MMTLIWSRINSEWFTIALTSSYKYRKSLLETRSLFKGWCVSRKCHRRETPIRKSSRHGRCRSRRYIAVLGRRRSVISREREGGKSNLRGRSRDQKKMEKRGKVEGPGSPEGIERWRGIEKANRWGRERGESERAGWGFGRRASAQGDSGG